MWILLSILNVTFAYLAEKNYENNKLMCKLFLLLLVVANVIIIGLRDIGVGYDTNVYIEHYFNHARILNNLTDLIDDDPVYDKGFTVLALISTMLGNDARILLFITELFVISFIVLGLYNLKKSLKFSIVVFIICYILRYQHESINLMRQFCAMAILLYGYSFFLQKKYMVYFICQIISYYFHSTSIIFLLIPVAHFLSQKEGKIKYLFLYGMLVICSVGAYFYFHFLNILTNLGVFNIAYADRYDSYSAWLGNSKAISMSVFIFTCICLTMFCFLKENNNISTNTRYMFVFLLCFEFLFLLLSYSVLRNSYRIAYYFGFDLILYISVFVKSHKEIIKHLFYVYLLYGVFCLVRTYIMYGHDSCLFYKSQILGIE